MSAERAFIDRLARFARHPAARCLADDAAVLAIGGETLVLTHDMLVEGVHYLSRDPAADVAWKLVAVNLSDLAAKGARPIGVLAGYMLGGDAAWDLAFADGLGAALAALDVPLLGGDTVSGRGGGRALGLTALGLAGPGGAPARSGARAGDGLWVTGAIGSAGIGLAMARDHADGPPEALAAYRRPQPRLAAGQVLAPRVHAMADISDGLLIDAGRMARASGLAVTLALDAVPLGAGVTGDRAGRLAAATAGDDYELLLAAAPDFVPPDLDVPLTRVGRFDAGEGLSLLDDGEKVSLPARIGFEHD